MFAAIVVAAFAGGTWAYCSYTIAKAAGTEWKLGGWDFRPVASDIRSASGSNVPRIEIDCSQKKYVTGGWLDKIGASRNLNYFAKKAERAESAFTEYDDDGNTKLAEIAAADAVSYWGTVQYLKREIECYDLASLLDEKPY